MFDSRLTSKGNEPIVAQIIFLALATAGTCIACALVTDDKKSSKMKTSELKAKIKEMVLAEMALDVDNMEDAPESEVDFLSEVDAILAEADEEVAVDDTEVAVDGEENIDVDTTTEVDPNVKAVQDALTPCVKPALISMQAGASITSTSSPFITATLPFARIDKWLKSCTCFRMAVPSANTASLAYKPSLK